MHADVPAAHSLDTAPSSRLALALGWIVTGVWVVAIVAAGVEAQRPPARGAAGAALTASKARTTSR
jgi:hypothetical protein